MIERMKRLDRKLMYQGSILDVYKDTMEFPNGTHEEWDFVSHRMGGGCNSSGTSGWKNRNGAPVS